MCATILLPASCGPGGAGRASGGRDCAPRLRVGIVTDLVNAADRTFDAGFWQGVVRDLNRDSALCAGAAFVQSNRPADFARNIQFFVTQGYGLIVTAGAALGPAAVAAALAHPKIKFATLGLAQPSPPANLTGIVFRDDQAGFMAGALAALISRSGVVGAIFGPVDDAAIHRFGEGYKNGAAHVNPVATVLVLYASRTPGVVSDAAWGMARAQDELGVGADVIMGGGGDAGHGAMIAAARAGRLCIGTQVDRYYTSPEVRGCLLTSAVEGTAEAVEALVADLHRRHWPGSSGLEMNLADGGVGLAPYHDLSARVPVAVRTRLAEIAAQLEHGQLSTGVAAS